MATYVIRNDFHGTKASVRVGADGKLSKGQVRRVRKALCGIDGCMCGGNLSQRGRQNVSIEIIGDGDLVLSELDLSYR